MKKAKDMNMNFVQRLDDARELSGVPFKITSGFRSHKHHDHLTKKGYKTSATSEHLKGNAADIETKDSNARYKILKFIHVDCSTDKSQGVVWNYY